MDNKISKMDTTLSEAAALIGKKSGADSSAIIIVKGNGARIYLASPGQGEPSQEEASGLLRNMARFFEEKANDVAGGQGEWKEVDKEDKPDLSKN